MATKWSKEWRSRRYSNVKAASDSDDAAAVSSSSNNNTTDAAAAVPNATSDPNNGTVQPAGKPNIMTPAALEQNYWEIVEGQRQEIDVEYGNDVDTTEIGSGKFHLTRTAPSS